MPPWSSLQRQVYGLIDPGIRFQVHCGVYRMASERGSTDLPRYWITLGRDVIWDYPAQFVGLPSHPNRVPIQHYPYDSDVSSISALLRAYIDTPRNSVLTAHFEDDHWGLINILRAADRRIGSRHWAALRRRIHNPAALKVLQAREQLHRRVTSNPSPPLPHAGSA